MKADRESLSAIAAFASAIFFGCLFFGDAGQVLWRLLACAAAAGIGVGAAKLRVWRPLALAVAWPAYLVAAAFAAVLRGAVDRNYGGPMMGVDLTWLPITSIVYGLPALLAFLLAGAVAWAIARKI